MGIFFFDGGVNFSLEVGRCYYPLLKWLILINLDKISFYSIIQRLSIFFVWLLNFLSFAFKDDVILVLQNYFSYAKYQHNCVCPCSRRKRKRSLQKRLRRPRPRRPPTRRAKHQTPKSASPAQKRRAPKRSAKSPAESSFQDGGLFLAPNNSRAINKSVICGIFRKYVFLYLIKVV